MLDLSKRQEPLIIKSESSSAISLAMGMRDLGSFTIISMK